MAKETLINFILRANRCSSPPLGFIPQNEFFGISYRSAFEICVAAFGEKRSKTKGDARQFILWKEARRPVALHAIRNSLAKLNSMFPTRDDHDEASHPSPS
jgi:hypothetical protein